MSSGYQNKAKLTKRKDTSAIRKDQRPLAELSSTLANSRSMSRFKPADKSKKQIPKILSKLERNVQVLKKYCSDLTPHQSKKKHDKYQHPGQSIRTVDDHAEETTAELQEVQKSYMSMYGKQTDNLIELWNFYNSFIGKGRPGKTSISSHSASIGGRSQYLPDCSLESRRDSGRGSVIGLIDRSNQENSNFSDLLMNRPSDRMSKPQSLQKVQQAEEESRPLQKITQARKKFVVKNVDFDLQTELQSLSILELHDQVPSRQSQHQECQPSLSKIISVQCLTTQTVTEVVEVVTRSTFEYLETHQKTQEKYSHQQSRGKPENGEDEGEFFRKIFQKNMLINKRKQQLNAKLQKGKTQDKPDLDLCIQGLDDAIIVEDNKPMFLHDELPLSRQDISLLEKLDFLDKQVTQVGKPEAENCVFQALKEICKKKSFQKSKFAVAQIPCRKSARQPRIIDIDFQDVKEPFSSPLRHKMGSPGQPRELSNSSLLDCEIQPASGEDSMLHNIEGIEIDL